jgi:aspartyl aminopeptidase
MRSTLIRKISSIMSGSNQTAIDFVKFMNASVSPFHAVQESERRLQEAGFTRLSERDPWQNAILPNGKYYIVRNQTAFVAFAVGGNFQPSKTIPTFTIAAAHTDSPCLRVKPVSNLLKQGYLSLGVETYGGGLWYTWLDRDLSLAGRVLVHDSQSNTFKNSLVRINKPLLKIPSLAIHLNRSVNEEGLKLNLENNLPPILCSAIKERLLQGSTSGSGHSSSHNKRHHPALLSLLANELNVPVEAIHDFDLSLFDTQPSTLGGLYDEFIYSARLDNLCMSYCILTGLINSTSIDLKSDENIRVIACFDHEEVGSASIAGAGSTLLQDLITRIIQLHSPNPADALPIAIRKSILVSADMAHAVHPNYPHVHDDNHRPAIHGGIVIKSNTNQRYATTSTTAFLFRQLASQCNVPVQSFVNRQDAGCGSTIGPILATRLGMRTVDVGVPQLSMHSCREMAGCDDVEQAVEFFQHMFGQFPILEKQLENAD